MEQLNNNEYNILVVEDDKEIRDGIEIFLKSQGYHVYKAADGVEGLQIIEKEPIHLAIVDIMMPRMDGVTMTIKLREHHEFPVIMLSAKSEETDKVIGLNIGADDYVTKPFNPLELIARVKSQLRRYTQLVNLCESIDSIYRVDGLEINDRNRTVTVEGREVKMTPIEYKILRLLVQERGKVLSISQIYESIWHMQAIGADNTIAVHIRHIREKIESNPKEPRYLKVVWGTGYKVG